VPVAVPVVAAPLAVVVPDAVAELPLPVPLALLVTALLEAALPEAALLVAALAVVAEAVLAGELAVVAALVDTVLLAALVVAAEDAAVDVPDEAVFVCPQAARTPIPATLSTRVAVVSSTRRLSGRPLRSLDISD
jgi:hypothetical protein